jgi:DnaK suppressor protein
MKQEELNKLEKEVREMISKLTAEIADLEESTAPIGPENSIGRISRMDAINNKSVIEASMRHRKRKLSKLKISLSKIHRPGFGTCARCNNLINPKRLMLMPQSDKCVKCA